MTPLERAALALKQRVQQPLPTACSITIDVYGEDEAPMWEALARAVIAAIREPSEAVALATASKVFDIASAQDEIDMGKWCWIAGIDATLEEG